MHFRRCFSKEDKRLTYKYSKVSDVEVFEMYHFLTKWIIPRLEKYIKTAYTYISNSDHSKEDLERMLELAKIIVDEKWFDLKWKDVQHLVKKKKNREFTRGDSNDEDLWVEARCKMEYLDLLHKYYFYLWY